jgi:hypothetical protein
MFGNGSQKRRSTLHLVDCVMYELNGSMNGQVADASECRSDQGSEALQLES